MKMRYVRSNRKKTRNDNQNCLIRQRRVIILWIMTSLRLKNTSSTIQSPVSNWQSNAKGGSKELRLQKMLFTYCTSGLVDRNKGSTLSYLHKAIKSLNQLRMIEDSLVIYRLSRAPERRIFYIDVGNLPKQSRQNNICVTL